MAAAKYEKPAFRGGLSWEFRDTTRVVEFTQTEVFLRFSVCVTGLPAGPAGVRAQAARAPRLLRGVGAQAVGQVHGRHAERWIQPVASPRAQHGRGPHFRRPRRPGPPAAEQPRDGMPLCCLPPPSAWPKSVLDSSDCGERMRQTPGAAQQPQDERSWTLLYPLPLTNARHP